MTPRGHSAPGKVRAEQGIIFRAVRKAGIRLLPAIVRTDSRDRRVEELLLSELLMLAADQGYAQAEISPVPAVDTATRDMLAALGADPSKTYAIYEKRF